MSLKRFEKQMLEYAAESALFTSMIEYREPSRVEKFKLWLNKYLFFRFDVDLVKVKPFPKTQGNTIRFRRPTPFSPPFGGKITPLMEKKDAL